MNNVEKNYEVWCKSIAETHSVEHLVAHLREHVGEHYFRHNGGDPVDLQIWLVGVLNFMHILEKKFSEITKEDMLFKLCRYYEDHQTGPEAPFNIREFINNYDGEIKRFAEKKN